MDFHSHVELGYVPWLPFPWTRGIVQKGGGEILLEYNIGHPLEV